MPGTNSNKARVKATVQAHTLPDYVRFAVLEGLKEAHQEVTRGNPLKKSDITIFKDSGRDELVVRFRVRPAR
jgi:hypothetical protein